MNQTTKVMLRFSTLILVGSALYLGGCGPVDIDDPAYLAQLSENESIADAADKDADATKAPTMMMKSNDPVNAVKQNDDRNNPKRDMKAGNNMRPGMQGMANGVAGAAGAEVAGVAAVGVVPVEVVELPPTFAKLPPEVIAQPPVITTSGENRQFIQNRLFEKDIHIMQPNVNQHLISNNTTINNQFHTNEIFHPSFANEVAVTGTVVETTQILPTTRIVEPAIITPPVFVGAVPGPIAGGVVGGPIAAPCAGFWSGGLYDCPTIPPIAGVLPVAGPYLR